MGQREAQRFDEQLMSTRHGFSIDQLMELAGLSVAAAVGKEFSSNGTRDRWKRVLVVAGPGNNGFVWRSYCGLKKLWNFFHYCIVAVGRGDALVAARHLMVC